MKRRALVLLCALLLLLSACGGDKSGDGREYVLYFATPRVEGTDRRMEDAAMESEPRRIPEDADVLNTLVEELLSGPLSDKLVSPFPQGVRQLSPPTLENGVCRLNLSEKYGGLSGAALTVADYCITLTLCQVPEVEVVYIDVEGEPLSYREHPDLRESDIILSSAEDEPFYLSVDLYFLQKGAALVPEHREVLVSDDTVPVEAVLAALLAGPQDPELYLPLPPDAHLLSAWVDSGGTCGVNFDAAFRDQAPTSRAEARQLLYAIVNTLCELPNVSTVSLQVEGQSVDSYGGVPTRSPLEANLNLVAESGREG